MIFPIDAEAKEFEQIVSGEKAYGILRKREDVHIGDLIGINEVGDGDYTGRYCLAYIDHIGTDDNGLNDAFFVIGFKPCHVFKSIEPVNHASLKADYSVPVITRDIPKTPGW